VYEVAFAAGAVIRRSAGARSGRLVRKDVYLEDISLRAAREIFKVALTRRGRGVARGRRGHGRATASSARRAAGAGGRVCTPGRACACCARSPSTWIWWQRMARAGSGCSRCGQPLGPASENYKAHCHRIDRPIQAASTLIGDPQRFIEDAVLFRSFCCPECGGLDRERSLPDTGCRLERYRASLVCGVLPCRIPRSTNYMALFIGA